MSHDLTIQGSQSTPSFRPGYWEIAHEINKLQNRFPTLDRQTIKNAMDRAVIKAGTSHDRQLIENYVVLSLSGSTPASGK